MAVLAEGPPVRCGTRFASGDPPLSAAGGSQAQPLDIVGDLRDGLQLAQQLLTAFIQVVPCLRALHTPRTQNFVSCVSGLCFTDPSDMNPAAA